MTKKKKATKKKAAAKKTKATKKVAKKKATAKKKQPAKKAAKKVKAKKVKTTAKSKAKKTITKAKAPKSAAKKVAAADDEMGIWALTAPDQPVDYEIVAGGSRSELVQKVRERLYVQHDGTAWIPQGAAFEEDDQWFQTMVKYD